MLIPDLERVYRQLDQVFKVALTDPYPHDLGRMRRLLERLGSPHAAYPSIIITGSKGKGSTATFLAALLGSNLGLFTGPHLHSYRERIKLNGLEVGPERFVALFDQVWQAIEADPAQEFISRFEILTAMAFLYFAQERVRLAVLEVGMGGRYDATNTALNVPLAVFSPIELEHVRNLGPTLADIVGHKSGIMRQGGQAITARQTPAVLAMLQEAALKTGATLRPAAQLWRYQDDSLSLEVAGGKLRQTFEASGPDGVGQTLHSGLAGTFQVENALTALAAAEVAAELGLSGPPNPAALAGAVIPGRLEGVGTAPVVLLDAAHTPNAMRELGRSLAEIGGRPVWVLGFLRDKLVGQMLNLLPLSAATVFLVDIPSHRNAGPDYIKSQLGQTPARLYEGLTLPQALAAARQEASSLVGGYVCVTGSLYLVAQARAVLGLLDPATAEEAELIVRLEKELIS